MTELELSLRKAAFADTEVRPVYADWLEEMGEEDKACFWRKAYGKKWVPYHLDTRVPQLWCWGSPVRSRYSSRLYRRNLIPLPVFREMLCQIYNNQSEWWKYFHTEEAAWTELERCWILTHKRKS